MTEKESQRKFSEINQKIKSKFTNIEQKIDPNPTN